MKRKIFPSFETDNTFWYLWPGHIQNIVLPEFKKDSGKQSHILIDE